MTERETVDLLVRLLASEEPFLHVRFGDGDVFFLTGTGPMLTADGEEWTFALSSRLRTAWRKCAIAPRLLVGDVESYAVSDGCEEQWRAMLAEAAALRGSPLELVHIEALRAGLGCALPLYRAVARDGRRKVYVAPERLASVAALLDADHVVVPLHVAHERADETVDAILNLDPAVVLFSAGRAGKIMQGELSEYPGVTQIDVGSGLDILIPDGVRRGIDGHLDSAALRAEYEAALA